MKLRNVVAASGLVAGLVACSGEKEADRMTKYADAMCACKTAECAETLLLEIEKWTAAADRDTAQLDRTQKCYDKLLAAGTAK